MRFPVLIILTLGFSVSLQAGDSAKNREGIKLYKQEKFEESAKAFSSIKDQDNRHIGVFNEGDALYKKGDFDKAESSFYDSLKSTDGKTQVESLFNLGNSKFQKKDARGALNAYQSALDLCKNSPRDIGEDFCEKISKDIRNNMQYVFNLKKQTDKEKQKQDKNKDKKDGQQNKDRQNSDNRDKDKDQKEKDRNKDRDKDKDDKDGQQDEKEDQDNKQGNNQPGNNSLQHNSGNIKKMNISPQQAKQLLNIIDSNDSNLQKKLLRKGQKKSPSRDGKDW
ncbi:MAG: tetratricopeptide repeat protein [Oligoflexia bacterium]|nr:tetratricopeptide repeat protein [Oligoflexia bacterium]